MHTKLKTRLMLIWLVLCLVVLSLVATTLIYADVQVSKPVNVGVNYKSPATYTDISAKLTFKLNSDGESYSISGVRNKDNISGEIIIPKEYNGKPITRIESDAFFGCKNITGVLIQDNIIEMGSNPFRFCTTLESIVITENPVYYSEGNCIIEKETKTLIAGCAGSKVAAYLVPEGVVTIKYFAFYGSGLPYAYYMPSSVEIIETYAFVDNENLQGIYFFTDSKIKTIEYKAFEGCNNFKFGWVGGDKNVPNWNVYDDDTKTSVEIKRSSYSSLGEYNSAMTTLLKDEYCDRYWTRTN